MGNRNLAALSLAVLLMATGIAMPVAADREAGLKAYQEKDYATAVRELEEVTRADPNDAAAFHLLGMAQLGAGETSSARASAEKKSKGQCSSHACEERALIEYRERL